MWDDFLVFARRLFLASAVLGTRKLRVRMSGKSSLRREWVMVVLSDGLLLSVSASEEHQSSHGLSGLSEIRMSMSGKASTIWTVKSGKEVTSRH